MACTTSRRICLGPRSAPDRRDQVVNPDFQAPECYMAFQTPFPISKDLMLVSARRGEHPQTTRDAELGWFHLYLMDYDGNMELLYQGAYNILHAQPVRSRAKPPVLPSPVRWPGKMASADQRPDDGFFYNSDVYEGTTIPRGMVKFLRVLEIESQTYCDGVRSTGREADLYRKQGAFPQFGLFGETVTSFLMDDATKRILGTVPVQEDGSVYFKAPPVRALYFQLLDGSGRCLHTMRSFTHVMPGETRSCVGCHETRGVAPEQKPSLVNLPAPSEISPPPWGDETVSFPRFVQPILDKHCVRCHGVEKTEAEIDLTHRTEQGTLLSWPYVTLVFGKNPKTVADLPKTSIAGPIFPYHTYPNSEVKYPTQDTVVPPLTAMSYRSRLVDLATSGKHYDVQRLAGRRSPSGRLGRRALPLPRPGGDHRRARHHAGRLLQTGRVPGPFLSLQDAHGARRPQSVLPGRFPDPTRSPAQRRRRQRPALHRGQRPETSLPNPGETYSVRRSFMSTIIWALKSH